MVVIFTYKPKVALKSNVTVQQIKCDSYGFSTDLARHSCYIDSRVTFVVPAEYVDQVGVHEE